MDQTFEVGKEYRNRYGRYEVLAIDEPKMAIRYEDGREISVTVAIQAQILDGIAYAEAAQMATDKRKGRRSTTQKGRKGGTTKADKREKVVAEILVNDEAIFEILTRLVIPPGQIRIYRFFLQNPDDFFSQQQAAEATGGSDQQSLAVVFMTFGRRIGGSPDPRVSSLAPRNVLFFEHKIEGGKTVYRIRQRVLELFATYAEFHDFLLNETRTWLPEAFGSAEWEESAAVHRQQMQYFGLWERTEE
jgi:hypothetical protein